MVDLSHWDFAEEFSGFQAAALILGLEPHACHGEEYRAVVVVERLKSDYQRALNDAREDYLVATHFSFQKNGPAPQDVLPSVELDHVATRLRTAGDEAGFMAWESDRRAAHFENQVFSRLALAKWIKATGLKSVYQFDRTPGIDAPAQSLRGEVSRWPWGNHHTEALGHLEAAARKWWGLYDPSEPDTAPTNATVAEWLVTERGVSQKLADSIASILRADNLRTGPR